MNGQSLEARIVKQETLMVEVKDQLKEIKDSQSYEFKNLRDNITNMTAKLSLELKDGLSEIDRKKASKLTQHIVYTMVAVILMAFLGTIIYYVGWKN